MAFSDHTAQGILDHITGKSAIFSIPTAYVALFTAVGSDSGTGFTEVVGNNYSRVATAAGDWNSASGSAPSSITNANSITFPSPSGSWGTVIAFGLYDAPTGGNLLAWDYLGQYNWLPCTITNASPCSVVVPAHGFSAADNVIFTTEYGGLTPTFAQSNLTGTLVVTSPTTDSFNVVNAGTPVFTASSGNGMLRKITPTGVSSGSPPFFAASSLVMLCA